LLEAAAKADGAPTWNAPSNCFELNGFYWNPLESDGDALRLAVKLRMDVDITDYTKSESGIFAMAAEDPGAGVMEPVRAGDDIAAATRRAIVRAAASISTKEK
jgi:hypothetical protein